MAVDTPGAAGATCALTSPSIGARTVVTQATVALPRGRENVAIHCAKECYYDGVGVIASHAPGAAGDSNVTARREPRPGAASGTMHSYASDVQVMMIPIAGCQPAGSPRPPARR